MRPRNYRPSGAPHLRAVSRRRLLTTGAAVLSGAVSPAARAAGTGLVLYTSQPDDIAAATVAAFRKTAPDVRVEVFRSGTTQVINKLAAEIAAGAPKADVLLIADAMSMDQLKAAGALQPEPGIDVAGLPAESYDPDRTYFGTKLITTGIVVNTRSDATPSDWTDLLDPKLKGQVAVPSPLYSGAAMITVGAWAQDPTLGQRFIDRLGASGATSVPGNGGVLSAVAGGQDAAGVLVDFMAMNAAAKGSPVRFVFPKSGVVPITEPVAILKSAHDQAAARAFVAFLLSKPGQELTAHQGFLPVRADIPPPPGFPPRADLRLLPVNVGAVLKDQTTLKRAFADAFGG